MPWILTLMTLFSLTLIMTSHPVAILSLIIVQTMMICLAIWTMLKSSWFSFIIFLIFLGGLMVLFVYIVSLASNEMFEPSLKEIIMMIYLSGTILMLLMTAMFFMSTPEQTSYSLYSLTMMIFSKSITTPTFLIMMFLLLTLVVAVKISSKFEGPLRNFIK